MLPRSRRIPVDVEEFLTRLGVRNVSRRGQECDFSCPFPEHRHADATPSARMNVETTAWYCHGCHRKGNAITFLAEHEGTTVPIAQRWVREKWGAGKPITVEEIMSEIDLLTSMIDEKIEDQVVAVNVEDLPSIVDVIGAWHYLKNRGFSTETIVSAGIRALDDPPRVVLPYWWKDAEDQAPFAVGYKIRSIEPDAKPKYKNYFFKASEFVYFPHSYSGFVRRAGEPMFVCEGELNALALMQMGHGAVGISGSMLSEAQATIIGRLAELDHDVILVWDCDAAGIGGVANARVKLLNHVRITRLWVAGHHDIDPADALLLPETQQQDYVRELIAKAHNYVTGLNERLFEKEQV